MTAMERTEELVHNLFVAQNELIAHLGNLKAIPNLAHVLFGSAEKNSTPEKNPTPEKNSAPEKNSSEMEKIRQTWMDDVVGLASEFYINEEAFNLDNLTELLKATVNAITDILALGPEENSVDQTFTGGHVYANHKKKFTFLDKLREDRPDLRDDTDVDIWFCHCPSEFGYEKGCTYKSGKISERCEKCWNREYKNSENWTCIDQLATEHPENVNKKYLGGAMHCPETYGYRAESLCAEITPGSIIKQDDVCRQCWKQPYKPQV